MNHSVIAVFIDGPLAQETSVLPAAYPEWRILLPPRATVCRCDPDYTDGEILCEHPGERYTYHLIAKGPGLAIYSKHSDGAEAIMRAVKLWVNTDLDRTDFLLAKCRDRRAFE